MQSFISSVKQRPGILRYRETVNSDLFKGGKEPGYRSRYSDWLDDRGVGVGVESRWGQKFSLLHVVQTGLVAHLTSYLMATGGSFPGGKAAGM
jgi:hypothetical protein